LKRLDPRSPIPTFGDKLHGNDRKVSLRAFWGFIKIDGLAKSHLDRHPGESRGPDVVPAKAGNQFKNWIPVFTGNPGFRLSPEWRIPWNFDFLGDHQNWGLKDVFQK